MEIQPKSGWETQTEEFLKELNKDTQNLLARFDSSKVEANIPFARVILSFNVMKELIVWDRRMLPKTALGEQTLLSQAEMGLGTHRRVFEKTLFAVSNIRGLRRLTSDDHYDLECIADGLVYYAVEDSLVRYAESLGDEIVRKSQPSFWERVSRLPKTLFNRFRN